MPDLPTRIREALQHPALTGEDTLRDLLREALVELERGEPAPDREGDCWTCERHYPDSEGWHCCHLLLSDPLRAAVVAWLDGWACPDDVPPRNGRHPNCPGWRGRT